MQPSGEDRYRDTRCCGKYGSLVLLGPGCVALGRSFRVLTCKGGLRTVPTVSGGRALQWGACSEHLASSEGSQDGVIRRRSPEGDLTGSIAGCAPALPSGKHFQSQQGGTWGSETQVQWLTLCQPHRVLTSALLPPGAGTLGEPPNVPSHKLHICKTRVTPDLLHGAALT